MDNQTQSFLELSAKNDLVQLVADKRAAWLWSADGARILWANGAGASFFSVQSLPELAGLKSLERSPARQHIARIATSGQPDKFSIERLRFYRGLRVMLLTCQCKRLELENGETAALIVCGDKGLTSTKEPMEAFARLVQYTETTAFLLNGDYVQQRVGELDGVPEQLDLPEGQNVLFGPLELEGRFHDGALLRIPAAQKLILLDNEPVADDAPEEESVSESALESAVLPVSTSTVDETAPPSDPEAVKALEETSETVSEVDVDTETETGDPDDTETASGDTDSTVSREQESLWVRADSDDLATDTDGPEEEEADLSASADEDGSDETAPDEQPDTSEPVPETAAAAESANAANEAPADEDERPEADVGDKTDIEAADTAASDDDTRLPDVEAEAFAFEPRRRPVRFAWKMDIEQQFTFVSDEFSEVLGPKVTDIVGLTWQEVADQFELDPKGNIARALDRRDTWSGRTVDWPVSGAALRVPVDMAALPAFDRNRKFEGYRGFGVCRTADAMDAPEVLFLSPALTAFDEAYATEPAPEPEPEPETIGETPVDETGSDAPPIGTEPEVAPEISEEGTSDAEDTTSDTDAGTAETGVEPATQEPAPVSEPQDRVEDLRPAQPDTFGGKTFLGASAAALVGSLARFTGKSGSKETESSGDPVDTETVSEEADSVGAALDRKLKELETGEPGAGQEPETDIADEAAETGKIEDDENENSESGKDETHVPDSAKSVAEAPETDELEGTEEEATGEEALADELAEASQEEEPVGINGPAELKPAEIESAVKSLAKSYNPSERKSPDLFDNTADDVESVADLSPANDEQAPDEAAETVSAQETTPDADELNDAPPQEDEDTVSGGLDNSDVDEDVDEREFFEETAAFEAEDQIAEAADGKETSSDGPTTGEVIPLATARPRVVPVDTSGLSRPERAAFRKIAEALGARLEGDLGDFETSDAENDDLDTLPPEVPEAGPIDPTLLDRLPIGISIVSDREVLYANKALLKMLGYKSITDLSEAGGLEALFIDDTEELPYGIGAEDEVDEAMKVRLADGGVMNVDAHMHSVPWNDSHGLMISVTERVAKSVTSPAEAPASPNFFAEVREELDAARSQIAEMDTILETATDGVLVLDQHGSIVKVNGSAEALFSANRSDMIGEPFTEFLAPESHRAAADYLDGLSRNGVASILNDGREILGKVPTGGLIPLFMTIGRIANGKGEDKFCAVLRDITQWKTAEEELTQAKRQAENASSQKSDFLAKISHEIRTPLNAIIGFSEVMMEERFGPIGNDRYKDYLKDIRTSGSHIMSLINDLLDLSKIEAGKLDLNFTAVSTHDVINECVALMQPQANRERVIIRASLPESVPDVVADPRSLRQIVLNLLSNAIKYNKSGGQVILSTALESNGEVVLRVRDTGTGMTAKQLAAALEPFRQLHTASRGGGTGLGLPLTKALVEANRASFHIDSTPDQGTLVEIVFPTQRVLSE